MEPFAEVMKVEEGAVADLLALGQLNPQHLAFSHFHRAAVTGRYRDFRQQIAWHSHPPGTFRATAALRRFSRTTSIRLAKTGAAPFLPQRRMVDQTGGYWLNALA
jgi:hypothetical protein